MRLRRAAMMNPAAVTIATTMPAPIPTLVCIEITVQIVFNGSLPEG